MKEMIAKTIAIINRSTTTAMTTAFESPDVLVAGVVGTPLSVG